MLGTTYLATAVAVRKANTTRLAQRVDRRVLDVRSTRSPVEEVPVAQRTVESGELGVGHGKRSGKRMSMRE